ncbi:MAG: hypothetical protein U1F36_16795 [Planctomycetota bacterium]
MLGRAPSLLLLALTLSAGCSRFEHQSGVEPLSDRRLIAQGRITGETGGVLAATADGLMPRVVLDIPPGAFEGEQEVTLWVRFGDPRLPSVVQSFEIEPRDLRLHLPATLDLQYDPSYAATAGEVWAETDIAAWEFVTDPSSDLRLCQVRERDLEHNLVRTALDRFGTLFCMHRELRSLALQPAGLVDPAVPVHTESLGSTPVESEGGASAVRVGRGSLDAFFASGVGQNLLVVPGGYGEALHIVGDTGMFPADVEAGLNSDFANIVAFRYPAGHAIRANGNALYAAIADRASVGFGCQILAHGSGGLVARWALEHAHEDPTRPGFRAGDRPLTNYVERVVFMATPNDGAPVVASRFGAVLAALGTRDAHFVEGLADLVPTEGGVLELLDSGRGASATRYFTIAGDVAGGGSDGLVDVSSAIGTQGDGLRAESHLVFSGPAYDHFALLALAGRTGVLGQVRTWFGKAHGNSRPIVSELTSPIGATGGVIEIPYSLVDAESDTCVVAALYTLDGSNWFVATPANGQGYLQTRNSLPAPGLRHAYFWNSRADGIGIQNVDRVVIRIVASDGGGYGTVGESGWFQVSN